MIAQIYRYQFSEEVLMEDAEASLLLALLATEFLHGESQVRLNAAHYFDAMQRTCVIDAATTVGMSLNKLFVGFLRRELGADSFLVERLPAEVAGTSGSL